MRKITGVIANQNVLFVILNQIRTKIGVMYGDPDTTPGGKAIPFHASTRIKLGAGQQIKDGDDVVGIHVSAKTIKNKVAPPFRKINFEIHFGKGIREHEQIFDLLRKHGPEIINGKEVCVAGTGAWKSLIVTNTETGEILIEKKFHKPKFNEIMADPEYSDYIDALLNKAMVKDLRPDDFDVDAESYEEIRTIALDLEDDLIDPEA